MAKKHSVFYRLEGGQELEATHRRGHSDDHFSHFKAFTCHPTAFTSHS